MSLPQQGEGIDNGTINIAHIVLSDEEEYYNSLPNHNQMKPKLMETEDSNEKENQQPTTSVQATTQKNKSTKLFCLDTDKYYYSDNIFVFIEKTNSENIGRLHPLVVGHILHKKLCIKNIVSIKTAGKNRIKVQLKTITDANLLVKNKQLESENLRAFIPNHLLEKKGLIRGVDTFFDNNYLKDNITSPTQVLDVQRMQRKTVQDGKNILIPKQTVIITFQGNMLPNEIVINSVIFPVEMFYGRVTQCFKCLKYGHISSQCRSTNPLCIRCAKPKTEGHECLDSDTYCLYCNTNEHKSNDKKCPTFEKQKKIKKIMIDNNTTFTEAKQYCDNSFSSLTSHNRFDILSDMSDYDSNFPKLPNREPTFSYNQFSSSQRVPRKVASKNNNRVSFSQPCSSRNNSANETPFNNTKKRKINPSPPATPTPFHIQNPKPNSNLPFSFKAPQIPTRPNFPILNFDEDKVKIVDCLSKVIFNFLGNLESLNEIKKINLDTIKQKINLALEEGIPK